MALQFICGILRDLDAERTAYDHRTLQIRQAANSLRAAEIARVCARHELEPDEFQTAEEKAARYL